jgi:hypothetical protein
MDLRWLWRVVRNLTAVLSILAPIQVYSSAAHAQSFLHPVLHPPPVCQGLIRRYEAAIDEHKYSLAQEIGGPMPKDGCYKPRPPIVIGKECSSGIKNIATFLQTCPSSDPAFATILHDFSVSYDSTPFTQQQLTQDLNKVCANISNSSAPVPTLTQQAEYVVSQVFRTMYYMDNQGTRGCPYPWTSGTSL